MRDPPIGRKGGSGDGDGCVQMSPLGRSVLPRLGGLGLGNWAADPRRFTRPRDIGRAISIATNATRVALAKPSQSTRRIQQQLFSVR